MSTSQLINTDSLQCLEPVSTPNGSDGYKRFVMFALHEYYSRFPSLMAHHLAGEIAKQAPSLEFEGTCSNNKEGRNEVSLRSQAYKPGELTELKMVYDEFTFQSWCRWSDEAKKICFR